MDRLRFVVSDVRLRVESRRCGSADFFLTKKAAHKAPPSNFPNREELRSSLPLWTTTLLLGCHQQRVQFARRNGLPHRLDRPQQVVGRTDFNGRFAGLQFDTPVAVADIEHDVARVIAPPPAPKTNGNILADPLTALGVSDPSRCTADVGRAVRLRFGCSDLDA